MTPREGRVQDLVDGRSGPGGGEGSWGPLGLDPSRLSFPQGSPKCKVRIENGVSCSWDEGPNKARTQTMAKIPRTAPFEVLIWCRLGKKLDPNF